MRFFQQSENSQEHTTKSAKDRSKGKMISTKEIEKTYRVPKKSCSSHQGNGQQYPVYLQQFRIFKGNHMN